MSALLLQKSIISLTKRRTSALETISGNGKEFEIVKLLGRGKGGYSYLVKREDRMKKAYVVQVQAMCALLYPANINIDYGVYIRTAF